MDSENLPKFVYLHKNHKYRLKLGFYAAPSNPKTFSKAIRDELDKLKFTYCSDLNGLVMGFGEISFNELIPADIRHCISVAVCVDVYIFRPPIGSIIKAIVNQTSDNHLSCLVHNLFNVSIVRPEHQSYNQWSGSRIKNGDRISVKVLSYDFTKKLPHITGDIIDSEKSEYNIPEEDQNNSYEHSSSTDVSVNNYTKSKKSVYKEGTVISSKFSSSDSESSSETDMIAHCKGLDDKSSKSSLLHITNKNSKNIKSPLFSSTPVASTEHTISSINLIRNKQLEKLNKHLAKNIVKPKSLDSLKSLNKSTIDNLSQCSNIFKNISSNSHNNDIKLNLPTSSVDSNDNSDDTNNINQQLPLLSDSGISEDGLRLTKFSNQNPLVNTMKNSTGTIRKRTNSNKTVISILNSLSPNKNTTEGHTIKQNAFISSNTGHRSNTSSDDEENTIYTQYTRNVINSDDEKSVYTQHKINNKYLSNQLSPIPDNSGSSSSEDVNSFTKDVSQKMNISGSNVDIKHTEHTSSSYNDTHLDDEKSVYTQYKHNLTNLEKKPLNNCNSPNKSKTKKTSTLRFSTKAFKNNDDSLSKNKEDCKNQIEDIINSKHSNNTFSMISDNSESSSSSEEVNLSIIDKGQKKDLTRSNIDTKHIEYTSSSHNVTKSDDEKLVYSERKHELTNTNERIFNNSISPKKIPSTLRLSTKRVKTIDTSLSKDKQNCINQIEKIINNKHSNSTLTMVSDSDNSSSEDVNLPIKKMGQKMDLIISNVDTKNIDYSSSSDDDIYSKLRQDISKIENTKHTIGKTKNEIFNEALSSDDDNESTSTHLTDKSILYSKLNESNATQVNCMNVLEEETGNCYTNKNKNVLKNEKSTHLQSSKSSNDKKKIQPNLTSNKNDLIKQILEENSSSDDEVSDTSIKNDIIDDANRESMVKGTKQSVEKTKNEIFNEALSSDDDDESTSTHHPDKSISYSKLNKSNATKVNCINVLEETDNCKANTNKNVLKNKKLSNKKRENDKSAHLQCSKSNNDITKIQLNLTSNKNDLIKQILEENSSSDEEINCTSIKNNIIDYANRESMIKGTKHSVEKTKNEIFNEALSSDDDDESTSTHLLDKSISYSKLNKSNATKVNCMNVLEETDNCNANTNKNVLKNKKLSNKKRENDKSAHLQSSKSNNDITKMQLHLTSNKNDLIKQILEENSSSDEEINGTSIKNDIIDYANCESMIKGTKHSVEKTKNEIFNEALSSDDDDESTSTHLPDKSISYSKLNKSNATKVNCMNVLEETDNCNANKNKNVLKNKKLSNKKQENDKSAHLQCSKSNNDITKIQLNLTSNKDDLIKQILEENSSSDEEINRTSIKNDIIDYANRESMIKGTKHSVEKTKNEIFNEALSSDDDDESTSTHLPDKSISYSKLNKSNATKVNCMNVLEETGNCYTNKNKNVLKNEKISNKKQENEKSTHLQSSKSSNDKKKIHPNLTSNKNDLIKQILEENSSSDDEVSGTSIKNDIIDDANRESMVKGTKHLVEKTKNEIFNEALSSDDDDESTSTYLTNKSILYSKLNKSNATKVNCMNVLEETDNCNANTNKNVLKNKKLSNKKRENEKSAHLQSSKSNNDLTKIQPNLTSNKNDLIKQILEENSSSDDEINCTSIKNDIIDKYKLVNENFLTSPISKNLKSNENSNKDISNPFMKLYTEISTNSSSDDDTFVSNFKKSDTPVVKNKRKKNKSLINHLLTSMKHKDKTFKQYVSNKDVNSSSSDRNKLLESNELKTDELKVKTNNKKIVLKKLKNPSEEKIFSTLSQNIIKQENPLHIKTQPSADKSTTDDEIDFIKQILENRKLNQTNVPKLIKKTVEPKASMKISAPTKLNKQKETSETINKESIPQNESTITTNEMNSDIIKTKKRTKGTKNSLVDSILNAPKIITNVVNSELNTKKKKVKEIKDFPVDSVLNALTTANEVNSDIKTKKKKARETKDLLVDYMLNTSTVKTNEINSDTTKSKKKKRSKESKDLLIDNVLNTSTITTNKTNSDILKRKKKKSKDLLVESVLNPMAILANEKNSNILNTKNKRPRETKNFIIDSVLNAPTVATNEVNSEIKTKKKKVKEIKDFPVDSVINALTTTANEVNSDIKTKKKKTTETKDLLVDSILNISNITTNEMNTIKTKKKRSNESKDSLIDDQVLHTSLITTNVINSNILKRKKKIPKETKDSLIDSVPNFTEDTLTSYHIQAKKKKKENYLTEGNVIEVKKKKKKKAKHIDDTNLNDLNVKDSQKQYILPNLQSEVTKKDQSTNVSKRKEKKKKVKRLKCDPINFDGPSKINDDHNKNEKMKRNSKKKPKLLTQSQLKDIVSSQDKDFLHNLDVLYSSFK